MMDAGSFIRKAWELVPIGLLLAIGGVIAVRSGVHRLRSPQDFRRLAGNISQILLRVLAYAAAMLVVHEWIGMRPGLGW